MAIVLVLAWAYVEYGTSPEEDALLYGIAPVVIAIVAQALWKLAPTAVDDVVTGAVAVIALVLYLLGVNELLLLLAAGVTVLVVRNARRLMSGAASFVAIGLVPGIILRSPARRPRRRCHASSSRS